MDLGIIGKALGGIGTGMNTVGTQQMIEQAEQQKEARLHDYAKELESTRNANENARLDKTQAHTTSENNMNRQAQEKLEGTRQVGENTRNQAAIGSHENIARMQEAGQTARNNADNATSMANNQVTIGATSEGRRIDNATKQAELDIANKRQGLINTAMDQSKSQEERQAAKDQIDQLSSFNAKPSNFKDDIDVKPVQDDMGNVTGYASFRNGKQVGWASKEDMAKFNQEKQADQQSVKPPVSGARQANDGKWYVPHNGGWAEVQLKQ